MTKLGSLLVLAASVLSLGVGCGAASQNVGPDDVSSRANRDRASTEVRSGTVQESSASRDVRVERSSSALAASRPTNTSKRQALKNK